MRALAARAERVFVRREVRDELVHGQRVRAATPTPRLRLRRRRRTRRRERRERFERVVARRAARSSRSRVASLRLRAARERGRVQGVDDFPKRFFVVVAGGGAGGSRRVHLRGERERDAATERVDALLHGGRPGGGPRASSPSAFLRAGSVVVVVVVAVVVVASDATGRPLPVNHDLDLVGHRPLPLVRVLLLAYRDVARGATGRRRGHTQQHVDLVVRRRRAAAAAAAAAAALLFVRVDAAVRARRQTQRPRT